MAGPAVQTPGPSAASTVAQQWSDQPPSHRGDACHHSTLAAPRARGAQVWLGLELVESTKLSLRSLRTHAKLCYAQVGFERHFSKNPSCPLLSLRFCCRR